MKKINDEMQYQDVFDTINDNFEERFANVINQIAGAESATIKKEMLVNGTEGLGSRYIKDIPNLALDDPLYAEYKVVPGQPNLLNGTSGAWEEYTLTGYQQNIVYMPISDLSLKIGDTIAASAEIENVSGESVALFAVACRDENKAEIKSIFTGRIQVGTSGISKGQLVIPEGTFYISWSKCARASNPETPNVIRVRKHKLIKGSITAMDEWTPSQADSGLTPVNGGMVPFSDVDYQNMLSADGIVKSETLIYGRGAEIQFDFPVIATLEAKYPALFVGLKTTAEKITKFQNLANNIKLQYTARVGQGGTKAVVLSIFNPTNQEFSGLVADVCPAFNTFTKSYNYFMTFLTNEGVDSFRLSTHYKSDGTTPAWTEVKDIRLIVELEVEGHTIIEEMIAAYHGENPPAWDEVKTKPFETLGEGLTVTDGTLSATANEDLSAHIKDKNNPHSVTASQVGALTAEESSANVVYQVTGKENIKRYLTLSMKNKVADSTVENPNVAKVQSSAGLLGSSDARWLKFTQARYDGISELTGKTVVTISGSPNTYQQNLFGFDVVAELTKILGDKFFSSIGANTAKQKAEVARQIISYNAANLWGYGTSPAGNQLTFCVWNMSAKKWEGQISHYSNTVSNLKMSTNNMSLYIDDDGWMYYLAYAQIGATANSSVLNIDYVNLELELDLSAHDHIESMIAANHGEKIATQEEAEAGTDNTKTMTPLRVAEYVDEKAVTIAGNQTIGGIKNFKDGVLLDDVPVFGITRNVVFDDAGVGGYFNAVDKISLGAVGKIDKVVLVWSRVDDSAGTLLNYSWSQTVLFPDDIILGNSYRVQLTSENYKFITFKNESGILTISGSNENSVAPNRIYRIKRIVAYIKK